MHHISTILLRQEGQVQMVSSGSLIFGLEMFIEGMHKCKCHLAPSGRSMTSRTVGVAIVHDQCL